MSKEAESHNEKPADLTTTEWLAVGTISSAILIISVISLISGWRQQGTEIAQLISPAEIELYIQGAVKHPGAYKVSIDTPLRDIIALAEPLPEANLAPFHARRKARQGQLVTVKEKPMVDLEIFGAVLREGTYRVPRGTILAQLGNYVAFADDADLAMLAKKRRVRAGERMTIPYRTKKNK